MTTPEQAIEQLNGWYKMFRAARTEPMNEEQSKTLVMFLLARASDDQLLADSDLAPIFKSWEYQVMDKRCVHMGLDIDVRSKIFITMLADNPATLVMYAAGLRMYQQQTGEKIDIERLCHVFPNGFIPEPVLSQLWDAQKGEFENKQDNLLDVINWDIIDQLMEQ